MSARIEPATLELVQAFARTLSQRDDLAAAEAGHISALDALETMHGRSKSSWALLAGDQVVAVCGVYAFPPRSRLWVHTSDAFKTAGLSALKAARYRFAQLQREYSELWLYVDSANEALVRLADWLGFKHVGFVEQHGRPFHLAVLRGAT